MDRLGIINEMTKIYIDVNEYMKICYFYIENDNLKYDLILSRLWLNRNDVQIVAKEKAIYFSLTDLYVKSTESQSKKITSNIHKVNGAVYASWMRWVKKQDSGIEIFTAFMTDIEKALHSKLNIDSLMLLLKHYCYKLQLFQSSEAEKLSSLWGPDIDHRIELKQVDSKDSEASWEPLYNMSREELLILCKELTSLLNKGFIHINWFPAVSPVLFIKKSEGSLQFCVNYRAFNTIIKKDCYPLLLIYETLNWISKAKWFIKLNVSAVFYKLQITEGQKWLTTFRTCYRLFEWLITSFDMMNAFSTFQQYINWILHQYLNDFCSVYLDNVLIFINGIWFEHCEHINKMLNCLDEAGLFLNIKKYEFEVIRIKYLRFIVNAGVSIQMDPEKIKAITEWQPSTTVKDV